MKEEELKKCLCRFKHRDICGICPCLIDLNTGKPLYKVLFKKNSEKRDFWEISNQKWTRLMKAVKKIEKEGVVVFNV